MTKEQLQKLYDLKLITLVTGEDVLLDEIKNMALEEALDHLKNLEIFNHVVDNNVILNLLEEDVVDEDDTTDPVTKDDDSPIVDDDDDDSPIVDDDDDDSPIVDDGE